MPRTTIAALSLVAVLGVACTSHVIFDLKPGGCINPPNGKCMEDSQDSRWLDVRIYQLKKIIDPCKLDLDEFKKGSDIPASVKGALTNQDGSDDVLNKFGVERNDHKRLPDWVILKETRAILVVALGRGRGKNSVRLIPVKQVSSNMTLHFSEYDICIGDSCESRPQEQCP